MTDTQRLRTMTGETGGTCDWGGCDLLTAFERWAPELGQWLPVCVEHSGPTWDRFSFGWGLHYARRSDRVLGPDELAAGLLQLVDDCRTAVALKDATDEQERIDAEYREQS